MIKLHSAVILALLAAGSPVFAADPTGLDSAGNLATVTRADDKVHFSFTRLENGVQVRVGELVKNIIFYGPSTVRVNANPGQTHTTQPSLTVVAKPQKLGFTSKDNGENFEIASDALRLLVNKQSGAITFLRPDGSILTQENATTPAEIKQLTISNAPTYEVKQNFTLAPNESLYGLGQYDKRYMDYRGQDVLMVQTNIGIVVPFLMSTNRYGILWDIYSKSTFKDDANGASLWAESAPAGVDYYFIGGKTMDGVISGYRDLTGKAPLYPKSAFGLWMSKERYKTQDRLIEVVKEFRKEGIPLDNIVQDWQYWGGDKDGTWSGMIWNKERFPDPAALTKTLHEELHVKLMNSIWPSVGDDTDLAKELDAKNLRFKPLHWISKKARIYDAFSGEGRSIYFKHIKKGLLDVGVDALWMDGTEVEVGGACHNAAQVEADIKSLGTNALGDFTRYLNPYTLLTTKGTYEGQRATSNKRVFTLTRSAWAGQQRYAALPWSGDTSGSWETLRNQISGGVNVAMAGLPYWTQDSGGFFIRKNWRKDGATTPEYKELFARWLQFSAFNPIYRIHGTDIEREIYSFKSDPEVYKALTDINHLRYRLIPYIYSMGWMSNAMDYTMMRGIPMDFPDDLAARKIDDQFLFGSLLVHPVTRQMIRTSGAMPPPPSVPAEVLTTPDGRPGIAVEYFSGKNFEKSASKSMEAKVDNTWPGPPLAEFPEGLASIDDFSGRWQGIITAPEAGEYEIGAEADDGARLWLDDKLVVEDWSNHPSRYKGARVTLAKGQKLAVKLEYYNAGLARGLRLAWKTPAQVLATTQAVDHSMKTYLPAGAGWYDFWTNQRFTGGQTVSKDCPMDILPLYVRAGSVIPMSPVMQYVTEKPEAPCEIRIYPGADGKFTIYEDDNETYNYEKGQSATVSLTWNDAAKTLTIGDRKGTFPDLVKQRTLRLVLATPDNARGIAEATNTQDIDYTGKATTVLFK